MTPSKHLNELMRKRLSLLGLCLFLVFSHAAAAFAEKNKSRPPAVPISEETEECVACHESLTPGIVEDWLDSGHSKTTPGMALKKTVLERRVSNSKIPGNLRLVVVGCYECHGLNPSRHKDNFKHNGFKINVVVSPKDCGVCHPVEEKQYSRSKKANALDILQKNSLYSALVETIVGVQEVKGDKIISHKASENAKGESCHACHGTKVEAKGMKKIETDFGEVEIPNLVNWPNQGVGRINPDGSKGSCSSCHPRHGFSIEIARKPRTCSQCHLAPDTPAWEIYRESKHGNIFLSKQREWNWTRVPWRPGKDFRAPTCASCHNSLLTNSHGEIIAERNHDFSSRLWTRIFGLIYSHPQPKSGKTYLIKNRDGLSLPSSFDGTLASEFLIDKKEQKRRRNLMKQLCRSCHSSDWANGHFEQMRSAVAETDLMVLNATKLIQKVWRAKLADPANPFDEAIERKWIKQWLFYANSTRYAAAMGGPDYAAFKYGWWDLTKNLREIKESAELKSAAGKKK